MAAIRKDFRLQPETLELIKALQEKLGVKAQVTVIEMAIKRMADQEGVKPSG